MIKTYIELELTPQELAEGFLGLNPSQQALFFNTLAEKTPPLNWHQQMMLVQEHSLLTKAGLTFMKLVAPEKNEAPISDPLSEENLVTYLDEVEINQVTIGHLREYGIYQVGDKVCMFNFDDTPGPLGTVQYAHGAEIGIIWGGYSSAIHYRAHEYNLLVNLRYAKTKEAWAAILTMAMAPKTQN